MTPPSSSREGSTSPPEVVEEPGMGSRGGMNLPRAVEVLARAVLVRALADASWEDWPEIGEDDWVRVANRAHQIANRQILTSDVQAAYAYLAARANQTEEDPDA